MRKWGMFIIFTLLVLLISACSGERAEPEEIPGLVEVEIRLPPQPIKAGEPVMIGAYVSQDGRPVNDARHVEFEYWNKNAEERVKVDAAFKGDGVYTMSQTFTDEGTYVVIAHVTARDMHVMPQMEFTIGDG